VAEPRRVAKEGCRADGRLVLAGGVAKERVSVLALLKLPVVLSPSAPRPVAVLEAPVVLLKGRTLH
jgi:hypothetical protein